MQDEEGEGEVGADEETLFDLLLLELYMLSMRSGEEK
jgi:hypothetical protein